MKIVFVSNYLNHHQIPFCQAMCKEEDMDFSFIQMEEMDSERVRMGWGIDVKEYPFAKCFYEDPVNCQSMIDNADLVIYGGVEDEKYIKPRLNAGKLVIRYSERIYKEGQWKFISPRGLRRKYEDHIKYRKKNVYLLCAGAYVSSDFHLIHAYPGKMFTWGYFPKIEILDVDSVINTKKSNETLELLWCGRMIDWKHPEYAINAAIVLKENNIPFHMNVIGKGNMKEEIINLAKTKGVDQFITFLDFVEPDKVREYMKKADIYLFTSDFKEGWGAVLNEAMNSVTCVIAGSGIGAVPSMLRHNRNGLVYKNGNIKEFENLVLKAAKDSEMRHELGKNAYKTVSETWNPENAGRMLASFARELVNGKIPDIKEGILSKAPVISPSKGYKYTRR